MFLSNLTQPFRDIRWLYGRFFMWFLRKKYGKHENTILLACIADADLEVAVKPDSSVFNELEDWSSETAIGLITIDDDCQT